MRTDDHTVHRDAIGRSELRPQLMRGDEIDLADNVEANLTCAGAIPFGRLTNKGSGRPPRHFDPT